MSDRAKLILVLAVALAVLLLFLTTRPLFS
jgi:hypothetical protein